MTKGRKTTFDERVESVQYCIAHDHNYVETSEKYQVSYQQARNFTLKYEAYGVESLRDHRGKRKSQDNSKECCEEPYIKTGIYFVSGPNCTTLFM